MLNCEKLSAVINLSWVMVHVHLDKVLQNMWYSIYVSQVKLVIVLVNSFSLSYYLQSFIERTHLGIIVLVMTVEQYS